jgi:uncharacterized membrane protein
VSDTNTRQKAPGWIKILLVISLAFNLLIIGAIGARFFLFKEYAGGNRPHNWLARSAVLHVTMRKLLWHMPRERHDAMRKIIAPHRRAMRRQLRTLAELRLQLAKEISDGTFRQSHFNQSMEKVKAAEETIRQQRSELLSDFIKGLTPVERQRYSQLLLNPPPRRRWFNRERRKRFGPNRQ